MDAHLWATSAQSASSAAVRVTAALSCMQTKRGSTRLDGNALLSCGAGRPCRAGMCLCVVMCVWCMNHDIRWDFIRRHGIDAACRADVNGDRSELHDVGTEMKYQC